jgi:hypothetical protein
MKHTEQELTDKVNALAKEISNVLDTHRTDVVLITLLHILVQEVEKLTGAGFFVAGCKEFMAGLWRGMLFNPEDN